MSISLGELAAEGVVTFSDGYRTKRPEHGQPGFRILRAADVADGFVSPTGDDFVAEAWEPQIRTKLSQPGDVLLTTKGTVGRVAIMPLLDERVVYSPQLCYFRVRDGERLNARWLSYWFRSDDFLHQASHRANNTDMAAYINLADIRSLQLPEMAIEEQRGIAEVLGALDDKIAANATLAATSLDLADVIFQRTADGLAFGSTSFEDVASIQGGGTPSTRVEKYWGGEVFWATPTDVTNLGSPYLERTARRITQDGFEACSSALHPAGSILMTSRATIGAFAIAQTPTAVNQGFIVVNAHDPSLQWWLFHEMRSRVPEFLSHANGATFLELSRGRFKKLPVRCPDGAASFQAEVDPIHRRARAAAVETERLANTRDLLLPLLMSGKIKVKNAERVVEGVV